MHDEHETDFLDALVRVNRYDGKTFGVSPFADAAGLWYRRDELEALDLEPPTTWSELRAVARTFADAGIRRPVVMPGGSRAREATTYSLIAFLASNGAEVLGPEGVTLDSRATAQALRFLRSLVEDGLVPLDVVRYEWNQTVPGSWQTDTPPSVSAGATRPRRSRRRSGFPTETSGSISGSSTCRRGARAARRASRGR